MGPAAISYIGRVITSIQFIISPSKARAFITGYGQDTSIPCATVGSCVLTDVDTGKQVAGVDVAQIFFDQSVPRQTAAKLGLVDEIQDPTDKVCCK